MERKTLEQEEEEDKVAAGADQEVAYSHNELEYIKRCIHALRNYQASRVIPRSGPSRPISHVHHFSRSSLQRDALNVLSHKQQSLAGLSLDHKQLLMKHKFGDFLEAVMNNIESNQSLLDDILAFNEQCMASSSPSSSTPFGESEDARKKRNTFKYDFVRIQELFRQIAREWSAQGRTEREACFGRLVRSLDQVCQKHFSDRSKQDVRVLVPGGGLSRLAFDIASEG